MKNSRSDKYFSQQKSNPIKNKEEVKSNPDPKIDQDFPGYPAGNATKEVITPKTSDEKKTAAVDVTDGEKDLDKDEQESDGSANAFAGK